MCFVLFFLNVVVVIFLSFIVVFMDYYTTIVARCLRVGMGVAGGGGGSWVLRHSQTRNKSCTSRAKVAIVRQTLVGPLLGWRDCTQANYLARVLLTN